MMIVRKLNCEASQNFIMIMNPISTQDGPR
jgi:hypothetical protein